MKITLKTLDETSTSLFRMRHSLQILSERHWLLDSVYGRELLVLKLRQLGLDLVMPTCSDASDLEALLCHVVEVLGIGAWPKPSGLAQRLRYLRTVLRMMLDLRDARQVTCLRGD
ncbi:MAG: hypothetical protein Q8R01_04320 [Ramlibacter sp.]|nr:hypothetical protein [Ramlibacter sp.]